MHSCRGSSRLPRRRQAIHDETPIIKQIQNQLDNLNPLKGKIRAEFAHVDVQLALPERFGPSAVVINLVDIGLSPFNRREEGHRS